MNEQENIQREKINGETAKIAWRELQRFFAQGTTIAIAPDLDLVEVGVQMACDNHAQLETWMKVGLVGPVSDAQAGEWFEANALMWSLVVRPWVLVQPVPQDSSDTDDGADEAQ